MGPNLRIIVSEVSADQNYQLVKFDGEFDKAGHSEIRDQLNKIVEDFSLQFLIFDFEDLKFINSEGIGYLMEIHAHLIKKDKRLVLIGPNAHVADVFQTIGIGEIIRIYSSLDDFLNKEV